MHDGYYLSIVPDWHNRNGLRIETRTLPGRARDPQAENAWHDAAKERWGRELPGWTFSEKGWRAELCLAPANAEGMQNDHVARGQTLAIVEDLANEYGHPVDALASVDWIIESHFSKRPYARTKAENIEQHKRLAELRNPYLEPYFSGRYPVRCPEAFEEFYADLSVFEQEIARSVIQRCPRKQPHPIMVRQTGSRIDEQMAFDVIKSLERKGWLLGKTLTYSNVTLPTAVRAGKSMLFSDRLLLRA